jgi:hypothetical protein
MQLVLFVTTALVLWLVLWALGQKAMDSFIYASIILLIGATLEILKKHLPNRDAQ